VQTPAGSEKCSKASMEMMTSAGSFVEGQIGSGLLTRLNGVLPCDPQDVFANVHTDNLRHPAERFPWHRLRAAPKSITVNPESLLTRSFPEESPACCRLGGRFAGAIAPPAEIHRSMRNWSSVSTLSPQRHTGDRSSGVSRGPPASLESRTSARLPFTRAAKTLSGTWPGTSSADGKTRINE